jgi:hypothetical protein
MSGAELNRLEREVEDARKRLADDLSHLRSPRALGEFKDNLLAEAGEAKDALLEKSKQAATDTLQRLVADLRERAAANPAAAMMIGAGLAWRLVQRPPIASLLVGLGAWSLWRDNGSRQGANGIASQAAALRSKAGETFGDFGTQASAVAGQASRSVAETVATLKDAAAGAAERASEAASQIRDQAMDRGSHAAAALQRIGEDEAARDKLLLGAAAVAVAAAVGIAAGR